MIGAYVVLMEKLIPRIFRTNRFIVISPSTKEDLVARGIEPDRIDVVLCGLDHDRYRNLGLPRFERPTIVHLGRLRKYKSVEVAIKAIQSIRERIPDIRLVIIGDGPYKENLERYTSRIGLEDSVEFRGFMKGNELVEFLNKSHLLFNTSPKEGWGLTVVEANACGLPVVASDRPGLRDSVVDERTGFLVPYGDSFAFAEKAVGLLEDGTLWRTISENALERVKELTWERCARGIESFLESVAGSREVTPVE
jgi:glycosyltransferase involved in cell wall biosynthesis